MCGRFVSTNQPDQIAAYFGADVATETLGENHNVAPTHDIYGVVADADGAKRVEAFHWGLIPSWAKDKKIASKMINARSETLAEKPAFKGLFKKKRILIPMDGFYEWTAGSPDGPLNAKGKPLKQPMFIRR
ncbi:MAG: SOS response-associated peptidase, partial [Actinomycetota bacterium]